MNSKCPRCGVNTVQNAVFCQNCGAPLPQVPPPPQQTYQSPHDSTPPYSQQPFMLQQIYGKIKGAAIAWLVVGILWGLGSMFSIIYNATRGIYYLSHAYTGDYGDAVGGFIYSSLILATAIINIIYAIIHFGYLKTQYLNPNAILSKIYSPTPYIISIVINVIFCSVIGIIGGVIMLTARSTIRNYQMMFSGFVPPNPMQTGMPPQPPVPPNQTPPKSDDQNQP